VWELGYFVKNTAGKFDLNLIKANRGTCSIPILLLSAQTTKRDIVAGFSHGADDYLVKPFHMSELVMRVNALLNNRRKAAYALPTFMPVVEDSNNILASLSVLLDKHIFC
jgi:DNA-binding response OmpR family regulator